MQTEKEDHMRVSSNAEDIPGWTRLHYAVWGNQVKMVEELLGIPSLDVNSADRDGFTALHLASWRGHKEISRLLLEKPELNPNVATLTKTPETFTIIQDFWPNIDPNVEAPGGITELHVSARDGKDEALKMLVSNKSTNLNCKTRGGKFTPLHLCAMRGTGSMVKLIIAAHLARKKGKYTRAFNPKDIIGRTPLHYAVLGNRVEVVQELLDITWLDANPADRDGLTALHLATRNGYAEIVSLLLHKQGIHPNVATSGKCQEIKTRSIIEKLKQNTPTPWPELADHMFLEPSSEVTPLHYAVENGHNDIVQVLLENAVISINTQAAGGITALHLACHKGNDEAVKMLVSHNSIYLNGKHLSTCSGSKSLTLPDKHDSMGPADFRLTLEAHLREGNHKHSIINAKDILGRTPLHYAVWTNQVKVVNQLLSSRFVDVHSADRDGFTALHLVSFLGHEEIARMLLIRPEIRCDPNVATNRSTQGTESKMKAELQENIFIPHVVQEVRVEVTPLHYVVERKHNNILHILLEIKGIDVNAKAGGCITPLHLAAQIANEAAVKKLVRHKSIDLYAQTSVEKFTALLLCASSGNKRIVKIVLETCLLAEKERLGQFINTKDIIGRTPLHYAVWGNHYDVVEELLMFPSVDINSADRDGFTALHLASWKGHTKIARLLLEQPELNPNVATLTDTQETFTIIRDLQQNIRVPKIVDHFFFELHLNLTSLHFAVHKGHDDILRMLLKRDFIDVNAETAEGITALHMAAGDGNDEALKMLVSKKSTNLNRRTRVGKFTPLHLCAMRGTSSMVKLIVAALIAGKKRKYTRAFNPKDIIRRTPLHHAVLDNRVEVVEELLGIKWLDAYSADLDGLTALHLATRNGCEEIASLLLHKKGRYKDAINAKDMIGRTPLHYAVENEHNNIVGILLADKVINVNAKAEGCVTALHLAARKGNFETLMMLVSHDSTNLNCKTQEEQFTALHLSAIFGIRGIVNYHVESKKGNSAYKDQYIGGLINAKDITGRKPLHYAAWGNQVEVVKDLLGSSSLEVNSTDRYGLTALHLASWKGHAEIVNLLLSREEINPNVATTGNDHEMRTENLIQKLQQNVIMSSPKLLDHEFPEPLPMVTPLHYAVEKNHNNVLERLLKTNLIHVNAQAAGGITALHVAAHKGNFEAVKMLYKFTPSNSHTLGPKHSSLSTLASEKHEPTRLEAMLAAEIHGRNQRNSVVSDKDVYGFTPLHYAVWANRVTVVEELLDITSVDLNSAGLDGLTALHLASWKGHGDVVSLLLHKEEIDLNVATTGNSDEKKTKITLEKLLIPSPKLAGHGFPELSAKVTPLHYAVEKGHTNIVRMLLKKNLIRVNAQAGGGITALHLAAHKGNKEIAKMLVHHQSTDLSFRTSEEKLSALHVCATGGNKSIMEIILETRRLSLLQLGALINTQDVIGRTPLHYAVWGNRVEVTKFLLNVPSLEVNSADRDGFTPLHLASWRGHDKILGLLLQKMEIDPNFATTRNNQETRTYIVEKLQQNNFIPLTLPEQVLPESCSKVTPLHYGVQGNNKGVLFHLVSYRDTNMVLENSEGKSALHLALLRKEKLGKKQLENENQDDILQLETERLGNEKEEEILQLDTEEVGKEKEEEILQLGNRETGKEEEILQVEKEKEEETLQPEMTEVGNEKDREIAQLRDEEIFQVLFTGVEKWKLTEKFGEILEYVLSHEELKVVEELMLEAFEKELQGVNSHVKKNRTKDVTLIHKFSFAGLENSLRILVRRCKDVNAQDGEGHTPLHYATRGGHNRVVKLLLEHPSLSVNAEDKTYRTALHWAKNLKEREIEKLLMERDAVRYYVDGLYRDRQVYVDAANAILVGDALIASVTFAGWLQPPLGYTPYYEFVVADPAPSGTYEYYASGKQHLSVRVFWVCNSLSFFSAMATVVAGARSILPKPDVFIREEVEEVRMSLVLTSALLALAVIFVLGAFGAAGFAALPPIISLEVHMIVTCILRVLLCVAILGDFLKRLYMNLKPTWQYYLYRKSILY